jgi:hypothetical protein
VDKGYKSKQSIKQKECGKMIKTNTKHKNAQNVLHLWHEDIGYQRTQWIKQVA